MKQWNIDATQPAVRERQKEMLADTEHNNQSHKTLNNQVLKDQLRDNNIAWNKLIINVMLSGFIGLGMYRFTI